LEQLKDNSKRTSGRQSAAGSFIGICQRVAMRVAERGVLNRGASQSARACSTFPAIAVLPDKSMLATYRVGSSKDSDDGTIEIRRSSDFGRTWTEPRTPLPTTFRGRRGSLGLAYVTPISQSNLLLAALWIDRETHPRKPLFNEATEGCLPMKVLLADSHDAGETWSAWRELPVPEEIGPPSLTNPILRFPCGLLAASIETNKHYNDESPWKQRVVYCFSEDDGQSWSRPCTVAEDPTTRIFNWDQRAAVISETSVVSFTWTYDRHTSNYLNIHRRCSTDKGLTWTMPEDLGIADQASHPAILPDGRLVLAWVDRFGTQSIRARIADNPLGKLEPYSELVLYDHAKRQQSVQASMGSATGEALIEMGTWTYGLPYAETLPDGNVFVAYYEPCDQGTQISWVRIEN
jgi:hypothetical protein